MLLVQGQYMSKKFQVPMQQMHVVKTSSATLNSLLIFIANFKMQGLAAGLSQNWPKSSCIYCMSLACSLTFPWHQN